MKPEEQYQTEETGAEVNQSLTAGPVAPIEDVTERTLQKTEPVAVFRWAFKVSAALILLVMILRLTFGELKREEWWTELLMLPAAVVVGGLVVAGHIGLAVFVWQYVTRLGDKRYDDLEDAIDRYDDEDEDSDQEEIAAADADVAPTGIAPAVPSVGLTAEVESSGEHQESVPSEPAIETSAPVPKPVSEGSVHPFRWARPGWRIGFWGGCLVTVVFWWGQSFDRAKGSEQMRDRLLGIVLAPLIGFVSGIVGLCAGAITSFCADVFFAHAASDQALETAMDRHDAVGLRWGEPAAHDTESAKEQAIQRESE
jgi:hypothetical protein